jgi:S1-C subfamily serine protease
MRVKMDLPATETGMDVVAPLTPLPELVIARGTPAERAGLRTGDKLVSILGQRGTSVAILSRLLATPSTKPVRIVYERGDRRSVVEVPNE